MKLLGSSIKEFVIDLLFTIQCIDCRREGSWLCDKCQKNLKLNDTDFVASDSLDKLIVIFEDGKIIRQLIDLLKYYFVVDMIGVLSEKLNFYFKQNPLKGDFYVLTPVPLHKRKYLQRGFNQSSLLAQEISKHTNISVSQLLSRSIYHHSQVGLSAKKRHKNISGSFKTSELLKHNIDKTIILVDDIYTTGATLNECAKELKQYGYKKVWAIVLAKG